MGYKVFIFSNHPIVEVGLITCVKKSLPGSVIVKAESLDVFLLNESNFNSDLFIFDVFSIAEMNLINQQLTPFFHQKKVIFFIEENKIEFSYDNNFIYLPRFSSEREIIKCLRSIFNVRKSIVRYKSVNKRIQNKSKFSEREMQCANLLMKGYSIGQISKELSLKANTISTYKQRLHKKTNTTNLVQLIKTLYTLE